MSVNLCRNGCAPRAALGDDDARDPRPMRSRAAYGGIAIALEQAANTLQAPKQAHRGLSGMIRAVRHPWRARLPASKKRHHCRISSLLWSAMVDVRAERSHIGGAVRRRDAQGVDVHG